MANVVASNNKFGVILLNECTTPKTNWEFLDKGEVFWNKLFKLLSLNFMIEKRFCVAGLK